ncbi:hypothetical protein FRC17_008739 [Serendipita sp. 399]|nr:hypothetical protein FRC17_008739 [Serendipita sp. 399]
MNQKQTESLKDLEKITEATPDEELGVERTKGRWMAIGDFLAILSLLAIVVVSIAVILTTFVAAKRKWEFFPSAIPIAKAGLASLTIPVLSTILRLLSQRYVYARLSNRGLRSQRVAHFNNWTVAEFLSQIFTLKFEPLGALLLVIWILGLVTGVTVRDSSVLDYIIIHDKPVALPSGPLDPGESSLVTNTSKSIKSLVSAFANGATYSLGYIDMQDAYNIRVFYPPLSSVVNGGFFSEAAFLNAIQVNVSHPLSVPSSAYKLNCTQAYGSSTEIWSLSNTTESLSFIHAVQVEGQFNYSQVDARAIVLGGTLAYRGESGNSWFQKNGTSWFLEMNENKWAAQLMDVVCSTVLNDSDDLGRNLFDFGFTISHWYQFEEDQYPEKAWSIAMGTAIGAFSSVKWRSDPDNLTNSINTANGPPPTIKVDLQLLESVVVATRWIYVLVANTTVSIGLLFALWRLFRASPLDKDFMDSTRLLLGPLNDRQLFNATLDQTIVKLENPYLQVVSAQQLLVTTTKSTKKKGVNSTKEKGEDSVPPLIVEI